MCVLKKEAERLTRGKVNFQQAGTHLDYVRERHLRGQVGKSKEETTRFWVDVIRVGILRGASRRIVSLHLLKVRGDLVRIDGFVLDVKVLEVQDPTKAFLLARSGPSEGAKVPRPPHTGRR